LIQMDCRNSSFRTWSVGGCERVLLECARPKLVLVTIPNSEYNIRFGTLPAGKMRPQDRRFE
jgi:hypothetical protein